MENAELLKEIMKELRYISGYIEFKESEEFAKRSVARSLPVDRLVPGENGSRCVAKFSKRKNKAEPKREKSSAKSKC